MVNHAGPAGGWKRLARKACVPSYFCMVVAVAWLVAWLYILVGAAIIMAIENPTRREPEATSLLQGELSYLEAVYWTETFISSCGFGDIVPVTEGGRGFLYVWSFFGCGLWALVTGAIVSLAYDWVLFGLVLWPWWHVRAERRRRTSIRASNAVDENGSGVVDFRIDLAASTGSGMAVGTVETWVETDPSALESHIKAQEVLTWPAVSLLVFTGLVIYFAVHLAGAAIFLALEPDLAFYKLPQYFPHNFGEGVYFTITSSQTMCMGEYAPQTDNGKMFYLMWHQQGLTSSSFLFSTVVLAILKWSKSRAFHLLERLAKAYRRVRNR